MKIYEVLVINLNEDREIVRAYFNNYYTAVEYATEQCQFYPEVMPITAQVSELPTENDYDELKQ